MENLVCTEYIYHINIIIDEWTVRYNITVLFPPKIKGTCYKSMFHYVSAVCEKPCESAALLVAENLLQ